MNISIINNASDRTGMYAAVEFAAFINRFSNHNVVSGEIDNADRYFILDVADNGSKLLGHEYRIHSSVFRDAPASIITGGSPSSLLTGVYEALGMMGVCFEIDRQYLYRDFDIDALANASQTFTPFVHNRGIRQHINFPMDISSYHLEEAREYIRNIARLRMNSITFHSYTGQWHGYKLDTREMLAGNFFYGQRHYVPDYESIAKKVANDKFYCIPEVENVLGDDRARSEFAIDWLKKLISTACEAGIKVTLSVELPDGIKTRDYVHVMRELVRTYDEIDALEWISPEGGGRSDERDFSELAGVPDEMPESLPGAFANLKKAIELYKRKDEIFEGMREIPIHIGLYVMSRETLLVLKEYMVRILPNDVIMTFLPAHGSLAVADNIDFMKFADEELARTMIYSWIEFDGNMYILQNSCEGIYRLLRDSADIAGGHRSVYGICLNHWRTAENSAVISYSAAAMINPVTPNEFYSLYALRAGIGGSDAFADAYRRLAEIDVYNRDNLFNIGFCYLGCWLGSPGLGWIRGWKPECIEHAIGEYDRIIDDLNVSLAQTNNPGGIRELRFLINRCSCSILHLKAIHELVKLVPIVDDKTPDNIDTNNKEIVISQCDKAAEYCRAYLDTHMVQILDRGCEGTAVSYYATIPVYIDHVRQYFAYGETVCSHNPDTFDQPPAPDTAYL